MNRYIFLHRIKGPVIILTFGVTALLDQWNILSFGQSWPLYLIVLGVLQLAERAAWTQAQMPPAPYPGGPQGYRGGFAETSQPGNWGTPSGTQSSTALSITPPDMPRGTEPDDGGRR